MSVQSDLASAFAEVSVTVPVSYNGTATRGFLDRAGTIRKMGGGPVQVEKDTLSIQKGVLTLVSETEITIGEVGALTADNGTVCNVAHFEPAEDGLVLAVTLTGGDW